MSAPDCIEIEDLETWYCVGVPDDERASPQRLRISVRLERDFRAAAARDDIEGTINYFTVCQRIQEMSRGREWRLIETLASDLAQMILQEFRPDQVTVEIKKYILPATRHVAVRLTRSAAEVEFGR